MIIMEAKMLYYIFFILNLTLSSHLFAGSESKILVIGDSLTEGYKEEKSDSWPSLVQKKLSKDPKLKNYKIINAGSSGATSAYGISVMKFHLKRYQPKLIVYALGANDGLRARPPEETKKDIEKAILMAKKKGVDFLLI
jgi:acyl-CoA thioesterase-1